MNCRQIWLKKRFGETFIMYYNVLVKILLGMKPGPIGLGWLDTCLVSGLNYYVPLLSLFKEIIVLVIGVQQDIM